MLSLTPANNLSPNILFRGGSDVPTGYCRNYSRPLYNAWTHPASANCQHLSPELTGGTFPAYKQGEDMLEGPTVGQFVALTDPTMLIINGTSNGTARFANQTLCAPSLAEMSYCQSLASGPVDTLAIYNPSAPKGSHWSGAGLDSLSIARLCYSFATVLPDASALAAGLSSNLAVELNAPFSTTYPTEISCLPYFASSICPQATASPRCSVTAAPSSRSLSPQLRTLACWPMTPLPTLSPCSPMAVL